MLWKVDDILRGVGGKDEYNLIIFYEILKELVKILLLIRKKLDIKEAKEEFGCKE